MKDWGPTRESTLSIFFDVYALEQSISRLLATAMADSPLTPEEYAFYSAIFEDEQITPTTLSRVTGTPLTTVMDQVARLEARGHARRSVDPRDRRATLVTLTATGLAAHRDANRFFESGYSAFVATLPVDEATAARWLSVIRGAVEAAAETAELTVSRA